MRASCSEAIPPNKPGRITMQIKQYLTEFPICIRSIMSQHSLTIFPLCSSTTTRAATSATCPSTSPWCGTASSSSTTRPTSKVRHFLFFSAEAASLATTYSDIWCRPAKRKFESIPLVYLSVMIFSEATTPTHPCISFPPLHKKTVISLLTAIRGKGESVPSVWKNTMLVSAIKEGQGE